MAQLAGASGTIAVQVVATLPAAAMSAAEASPPTLHSAETASRGKISAMPMAGVRNFSNSHSTSQDGAQVDAVQVPPVIN